ncbi:hypothetical protein [Croceiramulus getboli]|nr:hypothetical protein P8624_13315 [Flavobacteriaceae bacterium YJPT1-3]
MQHGIIYPTHPSYNTILKAKAIAYKPDHIFCYGHNDKKCLENLGYLNSRNIHVVGSYGLWKFKNYKFQTGDYLNEKIEIKKKTALVIATVNDIDQLYKFCTELDNIEIDYTFLILPRYGINHLKNTNGVKVLDPNRTNIFEAYQVSDLLLTMSSSSALESLFLGIPTFIIEKGAKSIFKINYSFINSFNYIKSPQEFGNLLLTESYTIPSADDINAVYALEVMDNFKTALDKVLNV